jgi:hypothetical protein
MKIHRRLKDAFDPHGILNPGRMYPFALQQEADVYTLYYSPGSCSLIDPLPARRDGVPFERAA